MWHISGTRLALQRLENDKSYKTDLGKAFEKLGKVHKEGDIRSYMDTLLKKNGAEMYESAVDLSFLVVH